MVTQISAQRSSKGEGGRGGRGNPPSRGAQVGFEQINQGRRRGGEDILSPALTCCAIPFPPYWTQAQQRDPALSPIEDVSPSLEMEAEQDSMNRLQVGSMIHQKAPFSTAWRHSLRDIRSMILVKNNLLKNNPILDPADHNPFEPALNPCKEKLWSFSLQGSSPFQDWF